MVKRRVAPDQTCVEMAQGQAAERVAPCWGNCAGGLEHELALTEGDVRYGQPGGRPRPAAPQHDIEIEHPCGPAPTTRFATELALNCLKPDEQVIWSEVTSDNRRAVGVAPPRGAEWSAGDNRCGGFQSSR